MRKISIIISLLLILASCSEGKQSSVEDVIASQDLEQIRLKKRWNRTKYVKPGITGDAQIHLRSNGSLNGNKEFADCLPEHDVDADIKSFRYKLYYDAAYAIKLSSLWYTVEDTICNVHS